MTEVPTTSDAFRVVSRKEQQKTGENNEQIVIAFFDQRREFQIPELSGVVLLVFPKVFSRRLRGVGFIQSILKDFTLGPKRTQNPPYADSLGFRMHVLFFAFFLATSVLEPHC